MTSIELQHIGRRFGPVIALDEINIRIPAGELLFVLGPSGCGKTTLLRIIAGLLEPSGGRILFDDRDVTSLRTEQRNAVMCFQNYALWPHMTVRQNVAFGLDMRGGDGVAARTMEALRLVQLDHLADRGHVERTRLEVDRRVVVSRLTVGGRRKIEDKRAIWKECWERVLAEANAEELRITTRLLERISLMFDDPPDPGVREKT